MLRNGRGVGRCWIATHAGLITCGATLAQSGKGTVHGHVADSSGGTLIGAEVVLQPIGTSAVSDARNEFASVLQTVNGDIEALIAFMQK